MKKRDLVGSAEEQDACSLDSNYLFSTHSSVCEKIIASKAKIAEKEPTTETIFSKK